jgi:hypothetical protein
MAAVQHPAGGPADAPRSSEARLLERAAWAHALPFILWIFLMKMLGDPSGWNYAVRTAVCLAGFLVLRPWRGYAPPRLVYAFPALAVGFAVFVLWVLPESGWTARHAPVAHEFYRRWLVGLWPPGRLPEPPTSLPYAPEVAGWSFALIRLAGSAFVIATIEEFFWRGFIYRWLQDRDWLRLDPGRFDARAFVLTALVFGLEHEQWFAGILAGAAYGWLYIRTRDIWAAVAAHGITNYLLGWYVLATGAYHFW